MEEEFRIPLKGNLNQYIICSKQHHKKLSEHNWVLSKRNYVQTFLNGQNIKMKNFIWSIIEKREIPDGYVLKYLNTKNKNNNFDNRIENIGVVTYATNASKKRKRENVSSKLLGVRFNKDKQKFHAAFQFNGIDINLGHYENETDAGMAYDIYIVHNNLMNEKYMNFEDKIEYYKTCQPFVKKEKKSKYHGVYKLNDDKFRINVNKISFTSKNELECAKKYDELVVKYRLDKKLNFPNDYPNYKVTKISAELVDYSTLKIKFKNGKETLISPQSYEKIRCYKISYGKYVKLKFENRKTVKLSRFLMDETDPKVIIDHIDGNKLNNRLENLRRTNSKGNAENKVKKQKTKNSTNYVGVVKDGKNYKVMLTSGNSKYNSKYYDSEEYAARDRDLYILKNHKDSLFHLYFESDWNIPGEIEKWTRILFHYRDSDLFVKSLFK